MCIYLIEGRYHKELDLIPLDLLAFPVLSLIVSLGNFFLCILAFELCLGNSTKLPIAFGYLPEWPKVFTQFTIMDGYSGSRTFRLFLVDV